MTRAAHRPQPPAARWDGIVFDLDGTLWDSTATVARAWDAVVRERVPGHRGIDRAAIRGVMGLAHRELGQRLFPELAPAERERLVQACYAKEDAWLRREEAMVYPGVPEGLAALAARYPLAIVSNCQRGYIETFFAVTDLAARFRDAECHGHTGRSKGENLADVVQRCGMRRAVFVGDTAGDEVAAAQAGIPFLHAGYGFGRPSAPCPSFADFAALTAYLLGSAAWAAIPAPGGDAREET